MEIMASYYFTGGQLYDRNICGIADTIPQNRDERCPPDPFSTHKHREVQHSSSDILRPTPSLVPKPSKAINETWISDEDFKRSLKEWTKKC